MATTLANLQTSLGYHLGCTISASSRWTTTQTAALLNQALRKVVAELIAADCWKLLHELEEEAEYELDGSTSYNVYTAIGNSTNYQKFIGGRIEQFKVREATIEEEDKTQNSHEYEPTAVTPWIIFYDYDNTSEHGNLPVFRIKPSALTGTFYFRYLKNSPTMASGDTAVNSPLPVICDDAVIFLAAAYCWSGDRNGQDFARFHGLYKSEMADLIAEYEQPIYSGVGD
jgi:hypothetical protein